MFSQFSILCGSKALHINETLEIHSFGSKFIWNGNAQCGTHHIHAVWPVPCDFDVAQWVCSMNRWSEKIEERSAGLFKSSAWNYRV